MTKPKKSITVNGKDVVVSEIDDGALMKNWLDKVFCGGCVGFVGGVFVGFVGVIVVSLFYGLRNSTGNGMKNGNGGRRGVLG